MLLWMFVHYLTTLLTKQCVNNTFPYCCNKHYRTFKTLTVHYKFPKAFNSYCMLTLQLNYSVQHEDILSAPKHLLTKRKISHFRDFSKWVTWGNLNLHVHVQEKTELSFVQKSIVAFILWMTSNLCNKFFCRFFRLIVKYSC